MLMLTLVLASALGTPSHALPPTQPVMNPALGLVASDIAAQPRLAQVYPPQQQGPWTFRPPSQTNARGVPPAPLGSQSGEPPAERYYGPSGQWRQPPPQYRVPSNTAPTRYPPARYGPYAQRPAASAQPNLEVRLLDDKPYVQEPVLLQLDVISTGNLATASPELAGFDAILLEELSGPRTSVRGSGRTREIVNSYLLALTPLRPGPMEVGPFKVSGTLAGGVPFSAEAKSPTRFTAQPVVPSVQPWLPLQALRLTRELDEAAGLEEGRPITLTLRMEATGGLGEQLPDLEPMLASDDFRSYRERTIVDSRLTDDGRQIQGIRTEVYTLVPYSGGRLQLPAVRVNWWNVETARRESSSVPIRSLSVAGESGPFGFGRSTTSADSDDWGWFWIPIGGLLMLLLGYWAGVWYRTKRPVGAATGTRIATGSRPRLRERIRMAFTAVAGSISTSLRRLDLRSRLRNLLRGTAARLQTWTPASMRVYRCALDAERAQSASEWALLFQTSACHSLRSPSREPLPRVADRILRLRPGADGERVRSLLQQLDIALYNGGELNIKQWKRELRRALRPGWGAFAGLLGNRIRRDRLPALNPTHERASG